MSGPESTCIQAQSRTEQICKSKCSLGLAISSFPSCRETRGDTLKVFQCHNPPKVIVKLLSFHSGCNCKRSGCLKNYCECYEAKIPCSANCRCIGCKNVQEKPENKSLMQLADAADIRTQQQQAAASHFIEQLEITSKPQPRTVDGNRLADNTRPCVASLYCHGL